MYARAFKLKTNEGHGTENNIYHSAVFLWPLSAFLHIFSFFRVFLCRHFVCFSPVSRPRTQILSLFILAAILNKFPLSVDKSVTWFLLCARVFSPAAAILGNLRWRRFRGDGDRTGRESLELRQPSLPVKIRTLRSQWTQKDGALEEYRRGKYGFT